MFERVQIDRSKNLLVTIQIALFQIQEVEDQLRFGNGSLDKDLSRVTDLARIIVALMRTSGTSLWELRALTVKEESSG